MRMLAKLDWGRFVDQPWCVGVAVYIPLRYCVRVELLCEGTGNDSLNAENT